MLHSWKPFEGEAEPKIKSSRSTIRQHMYIVIDFRNIDDPLIDQEFFKSVAKKHQMLNKEFRTLRLSLGKKKK